MNREQLFQELVDACTTLISYIEHHSAYHSYEITDLVTQYARLWNLNAEQIRDLYYAAMLHDIGEVVLKGELLSKTGKLEEKESAMMQQHPLIGYRFVSRIPSMERAACIIRWHHENYDGTGYPDMLSYRAFPIESQILRIADAFVSLQSERPYRKALSADEAKKVLASQKGVMCSAPIVQRFLSALEAGEISYKPGKATLSFPASYPAVEITREEGEAILLAFSMGLADFIAHRIPYLKGYGFRVGMVTDLLAQELQLNDRERFLLFLASFLFETGMAVLPSEILFCRKPLTAEQRVLMERHSEVSAKVCSKIRSYPELEQIVKSHHEHFDGSGYPEGLKGDAIPALSQILGLSATFVSLISPRPYRAAYRVPQAISILSSLMGRFFPPHLRPVLALLRQEYV